MRLLFIALIATLLTASQARGNEVGVPFVFTQDQSAPQTDLIQDMTPTNALRIDPYLNASMTRLEYMLTRMEFALNSEIDIAVVREVMTKNFERLARPLHPESIRGFAWYSDQSGRVLVGYSIEGMGRPRVPMRETCELILRGVGYTLPHEHAGYTLQNRLLGVLYQKEPGAYTAVLAKLAAQFVHRVKISAETEDGKVHHTFVCQRTTKDGPVTYAKNSFRLK